MCCIAPRCGVCLRLGVARARGGSRGTLTSGHMTVTDLVVPGGTDHGVRVVVAEQVQVRAGPSVVVSNMHGRSRCGASLRRRPHDMEIGHLALAREIGRTRPEMWMLKAIESSVRLRPCPKRTRILSSAKAPPHRPRYFQRCSERRLRPVCRARQRCSEIKLLLVPKLFDLSPTPRCNCADCRDETVRGPSR